MAKGCWRRTAEAMDFRIELAEAVQGPVVVGYGAHFGIEMFVPGIDSIVKENIKRDDELIVK